MALSKKTKKVVSQRPVTPQQDYYPDRSATDLSIKGDIVNRLPFSEFPRTTEDMSKMFSWEYGDDDVKGSQAAAHLGGLNYRNDINKAVSEKDQYKNFYVDTFKPIGEQLAER